MAPSTRTRKRAASPAEEDDTSTKPAPKQPRKSNKKTTAAAAGDDDADAIASAPAATTKTKAKPKPKSKKEAASEAPVEVEDDVNEAEAPSRNLVVPVDEGCPLSAHKVYINPEDGVPYDATLNETKAGTNANKFYRIQLLTDGTYYQTWTRWGRVGTYGQTKLIRGDGSLASALDSFEKKFKEKAKLRWSDRANPPNFEAYVFLERNYEPEAASETSHGSGKTKSGVEMPKCTLEPPVQSLMELIFNQAYMESTMAELNYDAKKLPLKNLSKSVILRGYEYLKKLGALIDNPSLAQTEYKTSFEAKTEELSNMYYSHIPHDFGRQRAHIITNSMLLKRELELLESLTDLKEADDILKSEDIEVGAVHPLDSRYDALGLEEMTPVESSSSEFTQLHEYLNKTRGFTHGHNYKLLDVFRIERRGETDRFKNSDFAAIKSDRRLLWHGSRSTNYGGILRQGLRIAPPEAPVNGYMFGKGIYLADMASKSANYCCSELSGGHALLLLCEAELGDPLYKLTNASFEAAEKSKLHGSYATLGQGRVGPLAWKDASCVHPDLAGVKMPDTTVEPGDTNIKNASLQYNEYICYDTAQVRLRYLLRVKMR